MNSPSYGYAGSILRIDLTSEKIWREPTNSYIPKFLGGRGLNQWILLKELKPWITPYEPANLICFGAGALAGTLVPGASRLSIDSKNALTAGIGSGNAGGWFASELKFAGYDTIVIRGKAAVPVYLYIEDENVSILPAIGLMGKNTSETIKIIKKELGEEDIEVLCIGPAGENMVKAACIMVSGIRAVGRCGLGSIMGSKGLKAIAVKGTGTIKIKEPDIFMASVYKVSQRLRSLKITETRNKYGTLKGSSLHNEVSALAYKNFEDDYIPEEHFKKITHKVFHDIYEIDRYACTSCPTPCGHVYRITDGPYLGTECAKAESNSVWDFGGKLAIDNASAILKAQDVCCQLGLDIDNASSVIAWAIDCYQNGIISKKDTDGQELNWGDHSLVLELLKKMAYREGFGNILAEGSKRASQIIGKGSEYYAFHIKGQDLVEAIRSMKGWALGVVVSARGGTHTRGAPVTELKRPLSLKKQKSSDFAPQSYKGKPKIVCYFEYVHAILDSLGVCFFTGNWSTTEGISPKELADFYSSATGINISDSEIMKIGERIHNVEKMFNVYHAGFTRQDDYPPVRLMEEKIKSGPLKGECLNKKDWDKMLNKYYNLHEWDQYRGWPSKKKLQELDLDECIEKLVESKKIHKF